MMLQGYLEAEYRQRLNANSLRIYRSVARAFDRFADGPTKRADESTVDRFRHWLTDQGYREATAKMYATLARVVLREAFPEADWLPRRIRQFANADVPGTLDHAFVNRFIGLREVKQPHTRRRYRIALELFSEHLGRPALVSDLNRRRVHSFLRWLVEDRGQSQWTAANHSQRIAAMWSWAARAKLVKSPPTWRTA
jgi:site-specific recombinase XerD